MIQSVLASMSYNVYFFISNSLWKKQMNLIFSLFIGVRIGRGTSASIGISEHAELRQHPGVGDVSPIRLLDNRASSQEQLLQLLQLLLSRLWTPARVVPVGEVGDESAHEFTCHCRYGKLHLQFLRPKGSN